MSNATFLRWRYRSGALFGAVLYYLALSLFTIIVLVPFYWMARASVSNQEQILMSPPLYFPTPPWKTLALWPNKCRWCSLPPTRSFMPPFPP